MPKGVYERQTTTREAISTALRGNQNAVGGRKDVAARQRMPAYFSWANMIQRCTNPQATQFADYGGRGITVCQRWQGKGGFENFLADMGDRPGLLTLDRIDVDGNYEPNNCRWATRSEQQRNRRDKKRGKVAVTTKPR